MNNKELKSRFNINSTISVSKTAFLCSRKVPASVVLKCYDWATEQRKLGNCIISGFHSKIEKDVFHYLLKGNQPIVLVLARGRQKRFDPEIKKAIDDKRLLVISPFDDSVTKPTEETALIRNRFMLDLCDEIVVGHASKGGMLEKLLEEHSSKKTTYLG